MPESVVTDSVVSFLKAIPPFQFLPPSELSRLAVNMTLEFFPKGTVILHAGHPASESLYVVHKGGVKLALCSQVGKQLVLDMRSEGEIFGLLSLMSKDVARLDVTAVEDTLCYRIPAEQIQKLISSNADVSSYLLRTSVTRYMDRSLQELRTQTGLVGDTERLLYSLSVADVPKLPAIVCHEDTTIRAAAQMLANSKATCVFVANDQVRAMGIITDRDFAAKVVAQGISTDSAVNQIMSSPVASVESTDQLFQALLTMVSRNIHHLLVTEQGTPCGVLTAHDLMTLQGKSPLNVVRFIDAQTNIKDLAAAQTRVTGLLPLLLREGAKATHVTRVIAEINDRVMAKILQFAEAKVGLPPVPYCWVVLGSEGRREQTYKTDQDNALIYGDGENQSAARDYFSQLALFVQEALSTCGYPPCPGNYMATNPQWCQPARTWLQYFQRWIHDAELHGVEDALIFFDMRPVAGDFSLHKRLSDGIRPLLPDARMFKSVLAYSATTHKSPLGFFRNLVLERSGEHRNQLDLKLFGTGPIVNAVRVFALEAGIEQTNTADRLSALAALEKEASVFCDLQDAFEFLMMLRLECQLRQVRQGKVLSNYIDPEVLTHLQRSLLKEAFRASARGQALVEERFRTAIWSQLGR